MTIWLLSAGIVFSALAAFFVWAWFGDRKSVATMRETETIKAADVGSLPPGTAVEIKGWLRCGAPVTGTFSQSQCAYVVTTVERDFVAIEYDQQTKRPKRVRKTEVTERKELFAPFELEDESGRVAVLVERATVEGIVAVERFEPFVDKHEGESFAKKALRNLTAKDDTLGFRYREMHLPLDRHIYVLGVTTAEGAVGAPPEDATQSFIVSTKSEEERIEELSKTAKWTLIAGLVCALLAVASFAGAYYSAQQHGQAAAEGEAQPQAC